MPNPQDENQNQSQKKDDFVESDKTMHRRNEQGGGKKNQKTDDKSSADKAAEMWEHINKSVSEDQREEIKNEIVEEEPDHPVFEGEVLEPSDEDEAVNPFEEAKEVKASHSTTIPEAPPVKEEDQTMTVGVPLVSPDDDEDEFKEGFWDIMAQAGLTRRRIFTILLMIVLGVLVLWFFFLRDGGGDEGKEIPVGNDGEIHDLLEENPLIVTQILGGEFSDGDAGIVSQIESTLLLGGEFEVTEERFVRYIARLRDLQNIYDVDVYQLLDLSVDRSGALERYLLEMNTLISEADLMLNEILLIMDDLEGLFTTTTIQRDNFELQFFSSAQALFGQEAYQNLDFFIASAKDASEIQAYFNAYKILRDMFINSLNVLKARYNDVFVNQEALIKGVRVFDVPDSDINAIIRLSN